MKSMIAIVTYSFLLGSLDILMTAGLAQESDNCERAITQYRSDIEQSTGAHIERIESRVAENPESPIEERQGEISIIVGSHFIPENEKKASRALMENEAVQRRYANLIVESCSDVSRVTYALNNSGYYNSWSLLNGQIRVDECIQHIGPMTPKPEWGQQICGI